MLTNGESLLLYLTIYCISATLVYLSGKTKSKKMGRLLLSIGIALPVLLAYFRTNVGTDFLNYQYTYRTYSATSFFDYIHSTGLFYGWGVWVISKIAFFLGGERAFFGIFALLTSIFAYQGFKNFNTSNWFLVMFAFLLGPFSSSLNIMKQSLAVAIVFWGIKYVKERNFIKYLLTILFAVLFHTTALIAIPIFFIYDKTESQRVWNFKSLFYVVVAVVVVANMINIIQALGSIDFMNLSRFAMYSTGEGTGNLTFFLTLMEFIVVLLHQKWLIKIDNNYKLLIVLMGLGLCFDAIGFFSVFVKRISMYYSTYPFLVLVASISETNYTKNSRILVNTGVAIFLIMVFVVSFYVRGFGDIIPYQYI